MVIHATDVNENCFFYSKVSRPDKLAVHVFEVDEDVDKDEVSLCITTSSFFLFLLAINNVNIIQLISQSNE